MGYISGSVVATADGVDSLSDAMISFIVFLGLRIAQRPADKTFHFGYHKVESFAALIAAIGMVIIGSVILFPFLPGHNTSKRNSTTNFDHDSISIGSCNITTRSISYAKDRK